MDDEMEDSRLVALDGDLTDPSKLERDGTPSSMGSSPDQDLEQDRPKDSDAPPLKRKGGRKPIYATSEERKQRNRQAQAAFRERRTEYIKTLELQLKQNEETLATLQQNHRSAADECLMLRYKNSLLERILLEKGIDVQAELQIKAGSPTFPTGMMQSGSSMPHPQQNRAPLQRAAVQRHHARRSANIMTNTFNMDNAAMSPQAGPTPSSHTSSPSNTSVRSPIAMQTGRMTPPTSAHSQPIQQFSGGRSQPLIPMLPNEPMNPPSRLAQTNSYVARPGSAHHQHMTTGNPTNRSTSSTSIQSVQAQKSADTGMITQNPSNYYPSPFQKHIDQLEQEYDTQDASQSMLDQLEPDPNDRDNMHASYSSQAVYPHNSYAYQQQLTPHSQNEQNHMSPTAQLPTDMIDPNDPLLDADPFGLTASMHYPTAYSFDHQTRR